MFKRILPMIAAMIMIANLSACGGKGNAEKKADEYSAADIPSYEEKEIGSAAGLQWGGNRIVTDSNNRILLYDVNQKNSSLIMIDKEGKKSEFKAEIGDIGHLFTLDPKGNLYVIQENAAPQKKGETDRVISYKLNIYSPEARKIGTLDLGERTFTDKQPGLTDIAVDSKGNLYLLQQRQSIEVISPEGKKTKDIPAGKVDCIEVSDEDKLIKGSFDGGGSSSSVEMIDPGTGDSVWKKDLNPGNMLRQMKYDRNSKCLYILCDKGVLSCSSNGELQGYVFDLKQSSLLGSGIYIYDFSFDKDKNLYVLAMKSDTSTGAFKAKPLLFKYTVLKGAKSVKQKVLTISTRYSDRYLESAVSAFQKSHPDIKIEVRDYKAAWMSSGDGNTSEEENQRAQKAVEDFERVNNTELMAGKGADIIEVYGLPYLKYIEKDALADLSKMIKKDKSFDSEKYNQKILNACKNKGNLYFIPLSFSFMLFDANHSLLKNEGIRIDDSKWTWNDFLTVAQKITKDKNGDGTPDQYALPKTSAEEMFSYICGTRLNAFIDYDKKKADFDSKEFIDILKLSKEFATQKICHPQTDAAALWQMTEPGTIAFMNMYFAGYTGLAFQQAIMNGEVDMLNTPSFEEKSGKEFIPGRTFGINNNSKLKEEAWEFIKLLISDEQQKSQDLYDFPINTAALEQKAKEFLANKYLYEMYKNQNRNVKQMAQKDIDYVNRLIDKLDTLTYNDSKVSRIVNEGAGEFFTGKKTAEEAAKMIQTKVSTYLGE